MNSYFYLRELQGVFFNFFVLKNSYKSSQSLYSLGVKIKTLTGHTTAVTSIDWKEMANGQLLLATCADDRTVHLRDGVNFEMKHVFGTKDIPGWYTLTYLSLNPTKHWCLCSTQNGRLVLWDCLSGERLACRKMHAGSIEGLVWNNDYSLCATVSSDCVVNTFSVDEIQSKLWCKIINAVDFFYLF